eukprot:17761-Heterococcus_DN1.PRE.3
MPRMALLSLLPTLHRLVHSRLLLSVVSSDATACTVVCNCMSIQALVVLVAVVNECTSCIEHDKYVVTRVNSTTTAHVLITLKLFCTRAQHSMLLKFTII